MSRYHDILRYHEPPMYLAFPIIKPLSDRRVDLVDGEGKKGYWAEGYFGYRFSILQGKYYSSSFLKRSRITLDVGLSPRLTRDNSSPLLPSNNKFGLGYDFLWSGLSRLNDENVMLIWTTIQFHHYSNGQSDSFYIDNPIKRNNYTSGDFSTNYYRVLLNISATSQQKSITSGAFGYQKEIDPGGPFAMSNELDKYYGESRLLFNFQWTQKPKLVAATPSVKGLSARQKVKLERRSQVSFRTELEYIIGDVSNYPGSNKYRLGWHNYLIYMPSVTNEVGFIAHTFIGRDYLNIRFDDPVFIGELGVHVKFNAR